MDNLYNNIGYIGWTEDAAVLALTVAEKQKNNRSQYAWCAEETVLPDYVTAVSGPEELAALCKILVLTEGSDPAAPETLQNYISAHTTCADFSLALPAEKYRRAREWESKGGFYVDVATEKPIAEVLKMEHGRFFYSGRCAQLVCRAFLWRLIPIYVPGEAGEATLMRLLRTTPTSTLTELLPYIDHFRKTCPGPKVPQLFPDQPENQGVANAIKRAKQMTDAIWQPIKPFPKIHDHDVSDDFSPEIPVVGMPYSSARLGETFIGPNISYESFYNALEDENSVLYTRDRRKDGNAAAYYGTVCSVLVSNALNLCSRVPCRVWPKIPGMQLIEPTTVENIKLGDALLNAGHVVIITGIDRTADGKVYQVEISESTHPICRRKMWRADEVTAYWLEAADCRIYRYDGIENTPYTPCGYTPLAGETAQRDSNADLAMNFGHKTNCPLGEELTFHIKTAGWEKLQLNRDGKVVCELPLTGEEQLCTHTPGDCGYYTAVCIKGDTRSKAVEFAVVSCWVSVDKADYAPGEPILVTGTANGDAILEFAFLMCKDNDLHIQWFTPEERAAGQGKVYCDTPDEYKLKLFFRNKYGVFSSNYVNPKNEEPS